jgi:hypothetical protein
MRRLLDHWFFGRLLLGNWYWPLKKFEWYVMKRVFRGEV